MAFVLADSRDHTPGPPYKRAQCPRARAARAAREEDHRPDAARAPGASKHRLESELIGSPRATRPDATRAVKEQTTADIGGRWPADPGVGAGGTP